MIRLSPNRLRVLRAAQRGHLRHSIYGGYDWIDLDVDGGGRVTKAAQAALAAGHIALRPRLRGDEHRGQAYRLTDDGTQALADHEATERK